jgi:hypothetical protein
LEDRSLLSALVGDAWPDAESLTLSFAADTARLGESNSALFRTFNKFASPGEWQFEILRAFQTWASLTNLNIGLVADSGDPFGTPGDIQGDYRFGDIRIGARPLSSDALANAVPFDWASGTWSGDILFNTNARFDISPARPGDYDLFTATLHEAGHALGLDHTDDPTSIMSGRYTGVRTGLSAADRLAIQTLHGTRSPDQFDAAGPNDTWETATLLSGTGNLSVAADLTTAADQDYYRFLTAANTTKFAVRLQTSGLSLLASQVTVFNSAGQVVGADVSTNPANGDLEVKVNSAQGGSIYTVRVSASRSDVFGVGRYQLSVVYKDTPAQKSNYEKDNKSNDSFATADTLNATRGNWWKPDAGQSFNGVFENKSDVDYYRLTAPTSGSDTQALIVQVDALNAKGARPQVQVFDSAMNLLPQQIIATNRGSVSIQVVGIVRGQEYFIRLAGNGTDDTNGNYRLSADFAAPKSAGLESLQTGTLAGAAKTATGQLTMTSSGLMQFGLFATAANGAVGQTVTLTITDAAGKKITSAVQSAGSGPVFLSVYLPVGEYTLTLNLAVPKDATTTGITYQLAAGLRTDPIGPLATTTSNGPGTTGTTPATSTTSSNSTSTSGIGGFFYTAGTGLIATVLPYSF